MSPRIKTGRITAAYREIQTTPPGSFPPHMQHLRPQRRARTRQAGRAVRGDRVNDTVALVRSLTTPGRKRGGARFGPAPEKPTNERMQAPQPMSYAARQDAYTRGGRGMTANQLMQAMRMRERRGEIIRWGGKGRATPKREASR